VIGRRLAQFVLEEEIGAGGMGVVYRARDERLARLVAIKVLPPGSLSDEGARTRFRQEASLLARINHPNIATIHDFSHHEEVDFIVMEFIAGESLDAIIARGPMPDETVRALAQQLCSGLAAAHQLAIVHRDLKPANLRITPDQRLKILDFGLAKLLSPEPSSPTAVTGPVLERSELAGTLPYMAPEQLAGRAVDARTDIHAAGAVLYEMATARRAFPGADSAAALIAAIIGDSPTRPGRVNASVSAALEGIILRCLEKEPARRYQSAREMALDLRPAAYPELTAAPRSVAVIPFDNLSGDQTLEYLRFALAETVATTLSRVPSIAVRPLASTRKYSSGDIQDASDALRVRVLVTGAFFSDPGALRISVEATDAASLAVIWSDTLTTAPDMLVTATQELRSRVGREFVRSLGVSVPTSRETGAAIPRSREGHDLYLRSTAFGMDDAPNSEAIRLLERALQLDPGFSTGWTALGRRYYVGASYGSGGAAAYRKSEDAYQRGLALDPDAVDAAGGLASHLVENGDLRAAYDVAARLRARQPDAKAAHHALGYVYRFAGLHQLSAEHAEAALRIDRDSALASFALTFLAMEDHGRALQFLGLRAGSGWADNTLMQVLLHQQNHADALPIAERLSADPSWPARFVRAFLEGRPAGEVASAADRYIEHNVRVFRDPESSYLDGALLAFCGQHEKAIHLIGRAIRGGYAAYPNLETDPLLQSLRSRPEYAEFVTAGRRVQQDFIEYLRGSPGA